MSKVHILGAGISGMLAAWACDQAGRDFEIIDQGPRSALPRIVAGCAYLHATCGLPAQALQAQTLSTMVLPTHGISPDTWPMIYHRKVWGPTEPYIKNSVEQHALPFYLYLQHKTVGQPICREIWNLNNALAWLSAKYASKVTIANIRGSDVSWLLEQGQVIYTLPLSVLFPMLQLRSVDAYIFQREEGDRSDGWTPGRHAYTLYNLSPEIPWYRLSSMFGYLSVEFNAEPPPGWPTSIFRKIVTYEPQAMLDAFHPNMLFVGRWGRWQRSFLSHQAYDLVREWL